MEQKYVVDQKRGSYVIRDRDGAVVQDGFTTRQAAAGHISKLRIAERKASLERRPCITCGTEFASEGAHNRMCNTCRQRRAEAPFEIGHRRARIGARK
jgi:tRNA(Ile2) C34 agmatinyltransferase TiaS